MGTQRQHMLQKLRTVPKPGESSLPPEHLLRLSECLHALESNSHPARREMQARMTDRGGGAETLEKNEGKKSSEGQLEIHF